eukprot:6035011-Heterocapsa_arctica.AAC.1
MILDARCPNRVLRDPPGACLCSSEAFARMEIELPEHMGPQDVNGEKLLGGTELHFGMADVK